MNFYSPMYFRSVFKEAVSKIVKNKAERTLLREKFENFTRLSNLFNSDLITVVYASYDSKFYIDDKDLVKVLDYIYKIYNIRLADIPPANVSVSDLLPITAYTSFDDIISQVKVLLTTKEAVVRKEEMNLITKELEKQRDRESARLRSRLASRLPKSIDNLKILALDFEYDQGKGHIVFECGITSYYNGNVQHEHYLVDEHYKTKRNYDLQLQFKFGESKVVSMNDLMSILKDRLHDTNYLVGHSLLSEYLVMVHHGLDITEMKSVTCMDTQKLFRCHFATNFQQNNLSLTNLLTMFDIQPEFMHNAGNDAAYTMMVLTKMARIIEAEKKHNPNRKCRIDLRKKAAKLHK